MDNKNNKYSMRPYSLPQIECITLDNEISLALESTPPDGPQESGLMSPEYFNKEPFKDQMI